MPTLLHGNKSPMVVLHAGSRIGASRLFRLSAIICFKSIVIISLILLPALIFNPGHARADWGLTLGGLEDDGALAMAPTPEGGYMVLGVTDSYGVDGDNFWLVKLSIDGAVIWHKTYGGTGSDYPAAICAAPGGGYVAVGTTDSVTTGEGDTWAIKIGEDGVIQWQASYGFPEDESAEALSPSGDGGYMIGGRIRRPVPPDSLDDDMWIMKLDGDGNVVWRKNYDSSVMDHISCLKPTTDGGYIVAGESYSRPNGDYWVLKLDAGGNIQWQKAYGLYYGGNENVDFMPQIEQTNDGGYILAGTSFPLPSGNGMAWVLKLASDGAITWQKYFLLPQLNVITSLGAVHQTADSGYMVAGATGSRAFVLKLAADGTSQWYNTYGTMYEDCFYALEGTADSGYMAMGYTRTLGVANKDLWVLKLDADALLSGCTAIQQDPGLSGTDTSESPLDPVVTVTNESPVRLVWSAVVSDPPADHVFSGDGCQPLALTNLIALPQTGQTSSYYTGDDGDIQAGVAWPSPRFVDNGEGTITDMLTGLIWLKDANCLGTHTQGDALLTVADFNTDPAGYACTDYDDDSDLDDWRLPNVNELSSVVNYEVGDKAAWLVSQGFADVVSGRYWSSSRFSAHSLQSWYVSLQNGHVRYDYNSATRQVWAVRGGQKKGYPDSNFPANVPKTGWTSGSAGSDGDLQMGVFWPNPRFTANGDGTVTDHLTGLVWLQDTLCLSPGLIPWESALDEVAAFNNDPAPFACANYDAGQHQGDWRLPNNRELLSLVDYSRDNPALPQGHPFVNVSTEYYWSSNTFDDYAPSPAGWVVRPGVVGETNQFLKQGGYGTIWPVRGTPLVDDDTDDDGIPDASDNCPLVANPGQEDGDSDGLGDVCDACPADPAKTDPGICGCDVADTDTDSDGTADCNDGCPGDPAKTGLGTCGCSVADTDSDSDGTPDCIDNCPGEANSDQSDQDGDGVGDACDNTPSGIDTGDGGDGDGGGGDGDSGFCFIKGITP